MVSVAGDEVLIKHFLNSQVECVVVCDGEFIQVKKKFLSPNEIVLDFSDVKHLSEFSKASASIFKIDLAAGFKAIRVEADKIHYDQLNRKIWIDNPFSSPNVLIQAFNEDSQSIPLKHVSLTPGRVVIDQVDELVDDRLKLEEDIAALTDSINRIFNTYQSSSSVPSSYIYSINSNYRSLYDRRELLKERIAALGDDSFKMKCTGIAVILCKDGMQSVKLRRGVNGRGVAWNEDEVVIKHNQNGRVFVVLDDALKLKADYRISELSNNEVKISFSKSDFSICTLKILKIEVD